MLYRSSIQTQPFPRVDWLAHASVEPLLLLVAHGLDTGIARVDAGVVFAHVRRHAASAIHLSLCAA